MMLNHETEDALENRKYQDVPSIGLGTFRMTDYEECKSTVREALEIGYRHLDGAQAYRNEEALGAAINNVDVPREELFITTKVLHPSVTRRYDEDSIVQAGRTCLERLGVDRVDCFYGIHWPGGETPLYDVQALASACERLYENGVFEYLGVSNLTPELIEEIRVATDVPLRAIQCEMHPLLPQRQLRSYARNHNMMFVAYAPLGNGRALELPEVQDVARRHDVSPAQVCLAWALDKNVIPIPKASSRDHLLDNWSALDLTLDEEDIRKIDRINRRERIYDPYYAPDWNPARLRS